MSKKQLEKDKYAQILKEMYGLRRFGIKLGLTTIRKMLKGLGSPEKEIKCIHIAGTNGKGSVASYIASILCEAGYKTGLYTSPHLVKFNERICINGQQVTDKEVVEAYQAVKAVDCGKREPTFFEHTTAMAFYLFKKKKTDWAIIETGMGGRLDATNVLKPKLSIVTNISVEHKTYLGNTISEIAYEKAGIIKRKIPVITGVKQQRALDQVRKATDEKSAPLYILGDAFKTRRDNNGGFTYYGMEKKWENLSVGLSGDHQIENATLAVAACEVISRRIAKIKYEDVKKGLVNTKWPGRLEKVKDNPLIILDGAHNLSAARNLSKYISANLKNRNITMVVGMLDDKPCELMLKALLPAGSSIILTSPKIDRSLPCEELLKLTKGIVATNGLVKKITSIPDVAEAVKFAIKTAAPNDAVIIAGSLYVVGEAKVLLAAELKK